MVASVDKKSSGKIPLAVLLGHFERVASGKQPEMIYPMGNHSGGISGNPNRRNGVTGANPHSVIRQRNPVVRLTILGLVGSSLREDKRGDTLYIAAS